MRRPHGFDRGEDRPDSVDPGSDPEVGAGSDPDLVRATEDPFFEATKTEHEGRAAESPSARGSSIGALVTRIREQSELRDADQQDADQKLPDSGDPDHGDADPGDADPGDSDHGDGGRTESGLEAVGVTGFGEHETERIETEQLSIGQARADLLPWRQHSRKRLDPVARAKRELKAAARARRVHERREQRRFSAEARRRRRNIFIAVGAVAGLVIFVLAGVVTPLTAVRDVQVTGASLVDDADVQTALERFDGTPLALVDDAEVHQALEPFPLIQRYAIERIPPHTLKVRIEERMPVLTVESDGEYRLYDPAGVLIGTSEAPPEGVPTAADSVSDITSNSFAAAATVLRDMPKELRSQVSAAQATSGQDLTFTLSTGERVIWGDAEQTQRKAVVLTAMLTALDDQAVEVIDVSSTEAPVFQ